MSLSDLFRVLTFSVRFWQLLHRDGDSSGGGIRSTIDAAKWRNEEINAVVNATFEAINNDPQQHLATVGKTSALLQFSKAKRKGQNNN